MFDNRKLPRLVYIGDVPVESSYHGSLLLYRLFSNYPKDKLLIIETDLGRSIVERRLPGVEYRTLRVRFARLTRSRLSKLYSIWLFVSARFRSRRALRKLGEFQPQAVVSIAHHCHWITAARLADRLKVPFHLIAHDNIDQAVMLPPSKWLTPAQTFGRIYANAKSRLCVSPYMASKYAERFGVTGTVLYPSRAPDGPSWDAPPSRNDDTSSLKIAFAGSINSGGYARLLRLLAESMGQDQLFLFGPHTPDTLAGWNLRLSNIKLGGLIPSAQLLERLRTGFDVLFVPMSFENVGHAQNMELSFPSKIADYTATGLPLLICGPEYSSAVRWAKDNPEVAEVVTSETGQEMADAVSRLRRLDYRRRLGERALSVGAEMFSYSRAESTFFTALCA